jgi:hypothetical protein
VAYFSDNWSNFTVSGTKAMHVKKVNEEPPINSRMSSITCSAFIAFILAQANCLSLGEINSSQLGCLFYSYSMQFIAILILISQANILSISCDIEINV